MNRRPSRLSLSLTLAAFVVALGMGLVHPLANTAHHDVVACDAHVDGHLDPADSHPPHDDTCVFCHLAQTLTQTTAPPAAYRWHHPRVDARLAPDVATRPHQHATRSFTARAPPCV